MKNSIIFFGIFLITGLSMINVNAQNVPLITINQETDAEIKRCMAEINADSIKSYMQSLEDIGTRWTFASNRKEVAQWIASKFESFGYSNVELQAFNYLPENNYNGYSDQYNVICLYPGKINIQIVIGAHHDAVQVSPGADDDASGTAGVLELARVIKKLGLETYHSFKFTTFAAEEIGLVGSNYSAHESIFLADSIALMLNMDMISNSPSDSLNQMGVGHKEIDSNLGKLATTMGLNYTGMVAEYFGYPTNSDHFSFGKLGIPAIFFEEYEFSYFYHTKNDLVVNTNSIYASRVIKTLAATSLAFDVLPQLTTPKIIQSGDGQKVTIQWQHNPIDNYYQVFIVSQNSGYQLIEETNQTSITLTDLIPLKEYQLLIKVWTTDGNANGYEFNLIPDSIPIIPNNIQLFGLSDCLQISWDKNPEDDIAGYQVYEFKNGISTKINNEILTEPIFSDYSITDESYHYYQVSAIDNSGNEGPHSVAQGTKLGKDSYLEDSIELLVILDISAMPTIQNETKDFFDQILIKQPHQTIVLNDPNPILPDLLNYSKKIIWCSPVMNANSSAFNRNYNSLIQYLRRGGKLLLSVSDPNLATAGFKRTMPSLMPDNHPSRSFLQTEKVDFIPNSYCYGLKTLQADYPAISINWESVPDVLLTNNYLNFVQSIEPKVGTNEIYSYQSPNPEDNVHGKMHGMPIGIEQIGSNFDLVFISIPLSFINQEEAASFINYVLQDRFNNYTNATPEIASNNSQYLKIWPNPAHLRFNYKTNNKGKVMIYNAFGIALYSNYFSDGQNQEWIDVSNWTKGIYMVTFQSRDTIYTQKLIID